MSDRYEVTIGDGLSVWRNGKLVHKVTSKAALMFLAFKLMEHLYRGGNASTTGRQDEAEGMQLSDERP